MIIGITYCYHDYQPEMFFIDSTLLDPANPIDKLILDIVAGPEKTGKRTYGAENWEENLYWQTKGCEPTLTRDAIVSDKNAEKIATISVMFE